MGLLIFFKIIFLGENSVRNLIRVSNSLGPDHDRHSVGPDLDFNCKQRLSADDTSRQRVKHFILVSYHMLSHL